MSSRAHVNNFDREISIFSPEGKLYQYAFKAVTTVNTLAVGVRGADSVVVDRLVDTDSVTSLFKISDSLGGCFIGYPSDCKYLAYRAINIAAEYKNKNGYDIPCDVLTNKLASISQAYTQSPGGRLTACVGIDPEYGTMLYRGDPAGFCCGFKAVGIGANSNEANTFLEKKLKKKIPSSRQDCLDLALLCLGTALGTDYKAHEVLVGQVTFENRTFHIVDDEEIDRVLTLLSERD